MSRILALAAIVVLWALSGAGVRAEMVRGLYAATVPVEDRSSAALAASAQVALAEVLVKVSGSSQVLQSETIRAALSGARDQVQQYGYVDTEDPDAALAARFEYDDSYVRNLLMQAGAPLWTANRPRVLAWVVVQDDDGVAFLNVDTHAELLAELTAAFERRGVPLQLPLFDLQDARALSAQDVWQGDLAALEAASERYNVQHIVSGKLALATSGSAVGDWSYVFQDERIQRPVTAADTAAFMQQGVAAIAEAMATRYAVAPDASMSAGVALQVHKVGDYRDYAEIVRWLQSLELVKYANVVSISGEQLDLYIVAQADAAQLARLIELNVRFVPVETVGGDTTLRYEWRR
ncbi:MAG: DUF2066 domain-containing protein [Pseudomonadota bacterium]